MESSQEQLPLHTPFVDPGEGGGFWDIPWPGSRHSCDQQQLQSPRMGERGLSLLRPGRQPPASPATLLAIDIALRGAETFFILISYVWKYTASPKVCDVNLLDFC